VRTTLDIQRLQLGILRGAGADQRHLELIRQQPDDVEEQALLPDAADQQGVDLADDQDAAADDPQICPPPLACDQLTDGRDELRRIPCSATIEPAWVHLDEFAGLCRHRQHPTHRPVQAHISSFGLSRAS
jgi:hypothetical protein